ncbi:MAG: peptidylprolyl isomerase [Chloroflexi bacterium]|nr:peptidylprolyl isomerase [Chloroflexota bacterium]
MPFLRQVIILLLLVFVHGCQPPEPLPPLIKVGQRQLTLQQFERELQLSYPDISVLPEQEQLLLKKQLVNRLIERELILGEAERSDVRIAPAELDAAMIEFRGNYSAAEYQEILREAGQSEESWQAVLRLRLLTMKVSAAILDPLVQVDVKDAEKYYLANREEFRRSEELRARQMLFDSKEAAEVILKKLKAGGNFAELAREYSLSPDRENGGSLGYFSQGQLPPEFDKVLFRLAAGQLSDPVESPYGVHLFLVERRRRAGLRPFAAVQNEIIAMLRQQREEEVFQLWLGKLHENTRISVHWDLLAKKDLH